MCIGELLGRAEKAEAALAAKQALIDELVDGLEGVVRLADMSLEESLREPEENGNYAAYNRARSLISKARSSGKAGSDA